MAANGGTANWAELVFADESSTAVLSRAVQRGTLKRLARGIYTSAVEADLADLVRKHLWRIVAHEMPGAVIADRSVRTGGMPEDGELFVIHARRGPLELPGVTVRPRQGPGPVDGDMSLPDGLWMSSTARALLDNLAPSPRTLGREAVEAWIEQLLQQRGESGLNALRDVARPIARVLRRMPQLRELESIIGAALATRDGTRPLSPGLAARAKGEPYDEQRVEAFSALAQALEDLPPASTRRRRSASRA